MRVINQEITENWAAYHGDCVETVKGLPDNSIDFSVYSPPFESLYTYSNSVRDMGNSKNSDEFWMHYRFLISEMYRAIKPGRLVAVHCMDLPTSKSHHGYIGLRDFPGEIVWAHQQAGFIYHSKITIWKDPVTAMQRTKALGLLHKQIVKDSCMSRQGIPDEVRVFRKPGRNEEPVAGEFEFFIGEDFKTSGKNKSIDIWQRYASPVWMDINPSDTLQKASARDDNDERHICPLQKQVIERCLQLWTNEGDTVLTPFGGIGSEGYVALNMGRKAILVELKDSYFRQLVKNMKEADATSATQMRLEIE
jgi:DNA modification methylase